jgi:hypothetical protein
VSNREAQAFSAELRTLCLAIEDVGGASELLHQTRLFCAMRERITAVEFEVLLVGHGEAHAPALGFILDDEARLDAWRN